MRIVYRRSAHRRAGAGFGLWKIATQVARFARSCLGVWRRASAQQIQSRERRANVVLLSVLSRRARRWRLAVMHVWQHTAVTNRRLHEQIGNAERELADKRRQASGSFIFAWRAQAVVAAKRRRASHRMLAKRRSRLLRCAILGSLLYSLDVLVQIQTLSEEKSELLSKLAWYEQELDCMKARLYDVEDACRGSQVVRGMWGSSIPDLSKLSPDRPPTR